MNEHISRKRLNLILRDLADELDVSPSKYREATEHYEAVGAWLDADDSELARYQLSIYPQGSFALGTAVKPLGGDEYDVDTVCLLQLTTDQVTQKQLKDLVGNRLKHPQSRYKDMIEPRERRAPLLDDPVRRRVKVPSGCAPGNSRMTTVGLLLSACPRSWRRPPSA